MRLCRKMGGGRNEAIKNNEDGRRKSWLKDKREKTEFVVNCKTSFNPKSFRDRERREDQQEKTKKTKAPQHEQSSRFIICPSKASQGFIYVGTSEGYIYVYVHSYYIHILLRSIASRCHMAQYVCTHHCNYYSSSSLNGIEC